MNGEAITCPMCGFRFDPRQQAACGACPLQKGCQLVCCPACGYQTIEARQTRLGRLAEAFFSARRFRRRGRRRRSFGRGEGCLTLADLPPGRRARVTGFLGGLPAAKRAHLQAYGLTPGCWLRVVQVSPVVVVQVENTELALEEELAGQVEVAAGPTGREPESGEGVTDPG